MSKFLPFIKIIVLSLAVVILIGANSSASAIGIMDGVNAAHGTGTPTSLFGNSGIITSITNTMLFLIGALAVIMIIIGGIRYTTSGGNSANVTAAKNTVVYAIIGLIVAFLSFAAINFILGSVVNIGGGQAGFTNV